MSDKTIIRGLYALDALELAGVHRDAGDRLGVSHTTVKNRLDALASLAGNDLLESTRDGSTLTAPARILLDAARATHGFTDPSKEAALVDVFNAWRVQKPVHAPSSQNAVPPAAKAILPGRVSMANYGKAFPFPMSDEWKVLIETEDAHQPRNLCLLSDLVRAVQNLDIDATLFCALDREDLRKSIGEELNVVPLGRIFFDHALLDKDHPQATRLRLSPEDLRATFVRLFTGMTAALRQKFNDVAEKHRFTVSMYGYGDGVFDWAIIPSLCRRSVEGVSGVALPISMISIRAELFLVSLQGRWKPEVGQLQALLTRWVKDAGGSP